MAEDKTLAAILAAIACYLERESQTSPRPSPWLRAGRQEQWLRRHPRHWQRGRREVYEYRR